MKNSPLHVLSATAFILIVVAPMSCFAQGGVSRDPKVIWKGGTISPISKVPCNTSPASLYESESESKQRNPKKKSTFFKAGSNWHFELSVTDAGMTLQNVKLESNWKDKTQAEELGISKNSGVPRYMAKKMDLPHYWIESIGNYDPKAKSLNWKNVIAEREVTLPDGYGWQFDFFDKESCTTVSQSYMFYQEQADHEPHKFAPAPKKSNVTYTASRWIPLVYYVHQPNPRYKNEASGSFRLTSQQRFSLNASNNEEQRYPQRQELMTDTNVGNIINGNIFTAIIQTEHNHNKGLKWDVIKNGESVRMSSNTYKGKNLIGPTTRRYFNPDNLHQTYMGNVDQPKGAFSRDKEGKLHFDTESGPGCPECIHIHWRWSDVIKKDGYGQGQALIPATSEQDLTVSIQKELFYYQAKGKGNSDEFFGHGGFYSSQGSFKTK